MGEPLGFPHLVVFSYIKQSPVFAAAGTVFCFSAL